MKKITRNIILTLLTCATVLGGCAPAQNGNSGGSGDGGTSVEFKNAKLSDVEIWGALATEKVLQDVLAEDVPDLYVKRSANIDLTALPGEVEGYQIIMTTGDSRVNAYDIALSDLTSGENKLLKENIQVLHEKYLYVGSPKEYYTTIGYYPDAVVPFENIKQHGENVIEPNNNQGLYINFTIPEDQPAGVYTGTIKLTIGGESTEIPVSIKVGNVGITSETHVKSVFLNTGFYHRAELDTMNEMYDKYQKFLFKYRCGVGPLLHKTVVGLESEIEIYADYALEYSQLKECPSFTIPVPTLSGVNTWEYDGHTYQVKFLYDLNTIQKYLTAIAYKGIENNVDTLKKAVLYGYDEPELNGITADQVRCGANVIKVAKQNVAQALRADTTIENTEMMEQIIQSMMDIPHIVTQNIFREKYDLEKVDFVYCPEFNCVDNENLVAQFRMEEDNEIWWYGCINPRYPYPTYHIDDTLVSARLLSWMQADYGIDGNVYWSTTFLTGPANGVAGNAYPFADDYYEFNPYLGANGEGVLLYPGKKYGIDGPVSCMRMEAIRDGLEEYEFIYKLNELYKESALKYGVELDPAKTLGRLYDDMYSGTRVACSEENFELNRARLISLLCLNETEADICVADIRDDSGKTYVDVIAKNGYTLNSNAQVFSQKNVDGGIMYTYAIEPGQLSKFELSYDTYKFDFTINSSAQNFDAEHFFDGQIREHKVGVTQSLVDASTVVEGLTGKMIKLDFEADDGADSQIIHISDKKSIMKIDKTCDKFTIKIYNPSNETISCNLLIEYSGDPGIYNELKRGINIEPGMNDITLTNIAGYNWSKVKNFKTIRLTFGDQSAVDPARTLYFVDFTIYKV